MTAAVNQNLETNFGSAVSSPGLLSSTSLAINDPLYTLSGPTDTGTLGNSGAPTSGDISSLTSGAGNIDVGNLGTSTPTANLPTDPAAAAPASSTGDQGLLSSLGSTLGGLAPSLIAGGIGLSQAKGAQTQSAALAAQLSALGGPYTAAGQKLLAQQQSGTLTPDKQNVVNTETAQGQKLIDSAAPLSAIAQAAYQNYQSGTLPPADQIQLDNQVAAQKQQVAQQLASSGITDSTILAGQYAQIDNQAMITKQQLLDARFATGNVAYDQWLSSTTQGQALQADAAKFASTSLDNMLTESLGLGSEGMQPIEAAIQLQIQSDAALSAQVNQLMGNLASAYAYSQTGGKPPGTAAGGASSLGAAAGKALGSLGGSNSGGGSTSTSIGDSIAGQDPGLTQGALDATAPALDPNTVSGLASTTDPYAFSGLDSTSGSIDTSAITDPSTGFSAAGGVAATAAGLGLGVKAALSPGGSGGPQPSSSSLGNALGISSGSTSQNTKQARSADNYASDQSQIDQRTQAAGISDPAVDRQAFDHMFASQLAAGMTREQIGQEIQKLPPSEQANVISNLTQASDAIAYPDSTFDKVMQDVALIGSVVVIGLATGGAAAGLGAVGAGAAGGAAAGGAGSALTGQNIGKGALLGAITGSIGGAASTLAPGLGSSIADTTGLSTSTSTALASGVIKTGVGAVAGEIKGTGAQAGAESGAVTAIASGAGKAIFGT